MEREKIMDPKQRVERMPVASRRRWLGLGLIIAFITYGLYSYTFVTDDEHSTTLNHGPRYPCSNEDPIKRVAIIG